MFKKKKASVPKKAYKVEFSNEGIKFNDELIDREQQINHVPEYLKGQTKTINPLNLLNYTYQPKNEGTLRNCLAIEKGTNKKIFIDTTEYDSFPAMSSSFICQYILNFPGIVNFVGLYIPDKEFSIPPENNIKKKTINVERPILAWKYMENENAFELNDKYLNGKDRKKINPTIRCKIIYGIAAIMKQVHEKDIIHSNLNTKCIYLDENFEPNIGGFNYRNPFYDGFNTMIPQHLIPFISPEILVGDDDYAIEPETDVYSFGTLVYRMFSTEYIGIPKRIAKLRMHELFINGWRPEPPKNIPENYWSLIQACWHQNPAERPSFEVIVEELKKNDYTLEEFGMQTDLESLHEYQKRIDEMTANPPAQVSSPSSSSSQSPPPSSSQSKTPSPNSKENIFVGSDDDQFIKEIEQIGDGETSVVYKVFDTRTKATMSKKVLKTDEKKTFKNLQYALKEFEFLVSFHHPCICRALKINTAETVKNKKDQTTVSIYLEYFKYKLTDYLMEPLCNNTIKTRIAVEIAHAMFYIHKHNLIHRDLKAENIMLNDAFEVKLIDFGLIKIDEMLSDYSFVDSTRTKGVGTFYYMSPEMLNEDDYDSKTDVYSFGILLYYIFTGTILKIKLKDKLNGEPFELPNESENISKLCINLVYKCLEHKPSKRPSFKEILSEMREKSFQLAPDVDASIVDRRDKELTQFENEVQNFPK